jgi:sulfate transport system ATP-binding protein
MSVRVEGLTKHFGTVRPIDHVDLDVAKGEFLALLGPSGSGKTTLLRVIAGLDHAEEGRVIINGADASLLAPRDRGIGFVFQHYALFRHMTVADNVAFGLRARKRRLRPAKAAIERRVDELLGLMQLGHLGGRFPGQISGGQRQRVALARALAVEPSVLLLDEPFGALDAKVRQELRGWLRELHRRLGLTTIFVTHDQDEALLLAERVAVMDHGHIVQIGAPDEVYDHPATPFIAEFLGGANRFEAHLSAGQVTVAGKPFPIALSAIEASGEGSGQLFIRPHDIRVAQTGWPVAEVLDVATLGPRSFVELSFAGLPLKAELIADADGRTGVRRGERLPIEFRRALFFASFEPRSRARRRPTAA